MKEYLEKYLQFDKTKYDYSGNNDIIRYDLPDVEEDKFKRKITYSVDIHIKFLHIELELFKWIDGKYNRTDSTLFTYEFYNLKYFFKFYFLRNKLRKEYNKYKAISESKEKYKKLPKSLRRDLNIDNLLKNEDEN
jgi:hypothetical protein